MNYISSWFSRPQDSGLNTAPDVVVLPPTPPTSARQAAPAQLAAPFQPAAMSPNPRSSRLADHRTNPHRTEAQDIRGRRRGASGPAAPPPSYARRSETARIIIQVGERKFVTTPKTLKKNSTFFTLYFSGNWEIKVQEDGTFFFDHDGDTFKHILHYQRTGIFPVFIAPQKGENEFDYALYLKLYHMADWFGIAKLKDWIKTQGFDSNRRDRKSSDSSTSGGMTGAAINRELSSAEARPLRRRFTPYDTTMLYPGRPTIASRSTAGATSNHATAVGVTAPTTDVSVMSAVEVPMSNASAEPGSPKEGAGSPKDGQGSGGKEP